MLAARHIGGLLRLELASHLAAFGLLLHRDELRLRFQLQAPRPQEDHHRLLQEGHARRVGEVHRVPVQEDLWVGARDAAQAGGVPRG